MGSLTNQIAYVFILLFIIAGIASAIFLCFLAPMSVAAVFLNSAMSTEDLMSMFVTSSIAFIFGFIFFLIGVIFIVLRLKCLNLKEIKNDLQVTPPVALPLDQDQNTP